MMDLLNNFTPMQVCTFGILFLLAIKAAQEVVDFFIKKYKEKFDKDHNKLTKEQELEACYITCKEQHNETLELYNLVNTKLDKLAESIDSLAKRVDRLTVSDRNDIKQYIVKEYHHFIEQQQIDDYSLDCILRRFEDYKEEGGNSYIHTLVEELKKLPKSPPA